MDLQAAESELIKRPKLRWLAREKESGRIYDWATIASGVILAGTLSVSYWMLSRAAQPGSMLTPPQIALLLIANLIPAIALMVLLSRRIAMARAAARAIEKGFGRAPVYIREGGSIPIVNTFSRELSADALLLGWGQNDDNTHSPNEKFSLDDYHRGTLASAHLWQELANL